MIHKYITKEDIKLIDRCNKALYLKHRHPELISEKTSEQLSAFKNGNEVGKFAWLLYPSGVDISCGNTIWGDNLVSATRDALTNENCELFEAGFASKDKKLFCRADIIEKKREKLKLTEVKSSASLKTEYILDAAFQYKVIRESGYEGPLEIYVAYINKKFIKNGPIDPSKFFVFENVTEQVLKTQDLINELLTKRGIILLESKIPDVKIGKKCWKGEYECPFLMNCTKSLPGKSIWNIGGIRKELAETLQNEGILYYEQITKNEALTAKQWIEVNSGIQNKPHIQVEELRSFMDSLELHKPHYYMDFETISPAIPKYDGDKPYSNVCFQFCLLYKTGNKNAHIHRVDFIAEPDSDPRKEFIETLLNATKKPGIIVVYNASFEKTRLRELAKLFPDLASEINDRIERIRDLAIPFARKYYYHPSFKGSYSLKQVLPVLVSDLSYDNLIINNGVKARNSYSELGNLSVDAQGILKEELMSYCYMDVYSLQEISDKLSGIIKQEEDSLIRKIIQETIIEFFQVN